MPETLPPFPVDDVALAALEHALDARLTVDEDGNTRVVGADMSVGRLLDFLAGNDGSRVKPLLDEDGYEVTGWVEDEAPSYTRDDVIRELIAEVRRLRTEREEGHDAQAN